MKVFSLIILLFISLNFSYAQKVPAVECDRPAKHFKSMSYRVMQRDVEMDELSEDLSSSYLLGSSNPKEYSLCKRFSSKSAYDLDPKTAWCEGEKGDGVGEILLVPVGNLSEKIEVWTGYGKSQELYLANNRPRKVKIFIIAALTNNSLDSIGDIVPLEEIVVELKDINGFQEIVLPKHSDPIIRVASATEEEGIKSNLAIKVKNAPETYYQGKYHYTFGHRIGIQVLSVYPGTKFKDTCISEIRSK